MYGFRVKKVNSDLKSKVFEINWKGTASSGRTISYSFSKANKNFMIANTLMQDTTFFCQKFFWDYT